MQSEQKEPNRILVIMGSARGDGNTASLVRHLCQRMTVEFKIANLTTLSIDQFDYSRHDDRDDFRSVIAMMLNSQQIVFATPVYWYSMSGPMKGFFDRLTDLLLDPDSRKIGRALAGRNIWLVATGTDDHLPPGFHEPFARTAAYFNMNWQQAFYCKSIKGAPLTSESLVELDKLAAKLVD